MIDQTPNPDLETIKQITQSASLQPYHAGKFPAITFFQHLDSMRKEDALTNQSVLKHEYSRTSAELMVQQRQKDETSRSLC